MKNSRLIYTVALMILVIATLGISSVRVLALLIEFDASALYYAHNAAMPMTFSLGAVAAVVIGLLFTVLLRSELDGVTLFSDSSVSVLFSALLGFIIFGCSLSSVMSGALNGADALEIAVLVMSIPAAVYFIMCVAMPVKSKNVRILLSIGAIVWMFLRLINTYFAGGVEINNPNRSLLLIATAAALLFIVSEGRFQTGTARRPVYIFTGFASLVVLGLYTLPNIVLIALRVYPDKYDLPSELTMLALFIYILVRMCMISSMLSDGSSEEDDGEGEVNGEEGDEYGVPAYEGVSAREKSGHYPERRISEWEDDSYPENAGDADEDVGDAGEDVADEDEDIADEADEDIAEDADVYDEDDVADTAEIAEPDLPDEAKASDSEDGTDEAEAESAHGERAVPADVSGGAHDNEIDGDNDGNGGSDVSAVTHAKLRRAKRDISGEN